MDMALPLDAREVLFHLNYMGYRNITKEQLKSFMTDLKKLIRFESNPQGAQTSGAKSHSVPFTTNIERLFESHTKTSLQKQRHKNSNTQNQQQQQQQQQCSGSEGISQKKTIDHDNNQAKEEDKSKKKPRPKSAASIEKENISTHKPTTTTSDNLAKETEPANKTKMWIRPQSAHKTSRSASIKKRTDPVQLYQEYQKDWERFKTNICETSRSDLRWEIRERLANRQT